MAKRPTSTRATKRPKAGSRTRPRRRAAAKRPPATDPPRRDPAALARTGELEAIAALPNHREAYKWLQAAIDYGFPEASDHVDDLLEVTSLRYDDGGHETAAAHWELGTAYLEGNGGVPRDLERARQHLERAFEHHLDLAAINAGTGEHYAVDELAERLPDDARAVLEAALAGDDYARAMRHLQRIRRLVQVQAPQVIIDDERRALREIVDNLCPLPTVEDVAQMGRDPLRDELAVTEARHAQLEMLIAVMRHELEQRTAEDQARDARAEASAAEFSTDDADFTSDDPETN